MAIWYASEPIRVRGSLRFTPRKIPVAAFSARGRAEKTPKHPRESPRAPPPLSFQHRQKILHAVNRAPEIDIHQPAKVIQRNLFKIAVQRDSGIIDEQRAGSVPAAGV